MSTPGTNYQPADDDTQYHEEWLSAYLDDELSAEQRQIVEDRLQRDSAAQQLLAELQSVRNLVGGLPVWQGKPFAFDASSAASGGSTDADEARTLLDSSAVPAAAADSGKSEFAAVGDQQLGRRSRRDEYSPLATPRAGLWPWIKPLALAAAVLAMLGVGASLWQGQGVADFLAKRSVDLGAASQSNAPPPMNSIPSPGSQVLDTENENLRIESESLGLADGNSADTTFNGTNANGSRSNFYNLDAAAAGMAKEPAAESVPMDQLQYAPPPSESPAAGQAADDSDQIAMSRSRQKMEDTPRAGEVPPQSMASATNDIQLQMSVGPAENDDTTSRSLSQEPLMRSQSSLSQKDAGLQLQVVYSDAWTAADVERLIPNLVSTVQPANTSSETPGLLRTRIPLGISSTESAEAAQDLRNFLLQPNSDFVSFGEPLLLASPANELEDSSGAANATSAAGEAEHLAIAVFLSREQAAQIVNHSGLQLSSPAWITARQDSGASEAVDDRAILLVRPR